MKTKLLLIFSFLSVFALSQVDALMSNQWFLGRVEIENENFYPPNNDLTGLTIFTENSSSTQLCNVIFLEYSDLTDDQFLLTAYSSTMIECPDQPGLDEFEGKFSSLFWNSENQIFEYSIETDEEWTHIQTLVITDPAGNKAYFMNDALSIQETSKNNILIFPNPVKEKLMIENPGWGISNIKITDTNGKTIFTQKINSHNSEIDFSNYPKGIYFVTLESEGKIIKTEKAIKN